MRIVSLLASGTEIVCALGAGDELVGRSHECDNPEWVRTLPACTRPAFDTSRSSREIDAEVRRRLKAGEPLYHVDADLISNLQPDLLVTQIHCDVCAVTPADVERSGGALKSSRLVSLSANTIADIYDGIRGVAEAIERDSAADDLIARMQTEIDTVRAHVRGAAPKRVVLLEWTDPLFASGNWVPALVCAAGGASLLGQEGSHSRPVQWEHIVELDPDNLIVAPCGFDLARTQQEIPVLECLPGWSDLRAVREGQVALADGNKYFNRSGTTIVETVQILAEILHPDLGHRQWHNKAWCHYR